MKNLKKIGLIVLSIFEGIMIFLTLVMSFLYYQRAKMPFNSEGRFDDGLVVYDESSKLVFGILAIVSSIISIILFLILRKLSKK